MKKFYLLPVLILSSLVSQAQTIIPSVTERPFSSFAKITNENPYVLRQNAGANNTWIDIYKYIWVPSPVSPFKKENNTIQKINNTWTTVLSYKDSFVLDNQNRIGIAFEDNKFNFPSFVNRSVLKYSFTYNAANKATKIAVQQASAPNYNTYSAYYDYYIFYNGAGKTIRDSTYYFQNNESYMSSYLYDIDGNNNKTYSILQNGDTAYKSELSYTNGKLHTNYVLSFNSNTDSWEPSNNDTFDYDPQGNLVRSASYVTTFGSGQEPRYTPLENNQYIYNAQNRLTEMLVKTWNETSSKWVNGTKYTIEYENNQAKIGYLYGGDAAGTGWLTTANGRLIFAPPVSIKTQPTDEKISIYPNPANALVHIDIPFANEPYTIAITNSSGKEINTPINYGQKQAILDVTTLSKGVYFVKVKVANEASFTQKLLVTE
jgi:hypothetical protein